MHARHFLKYSCSEIACLPGIAAIGIDAAHFSTLLQVTLRILAEVAAVTIDRRALPCLLTKIDAPHQPWPVIGLSPQQAVAPISNHYQGELPKVQQVLDSCAVSCLP